MRGKLLLVITLVVVLVLAFAGVAGAAVSQDTIEAIIADLADNGIIDGTWTAEEIAAAIDAIRNDPKYKQYSDVLGELEDYLAELKADDVKDGGELAFTGAPLLLLLAGGAGLVGGGLLLRRRAA